MKLGVSTSLYLQDPVEAGIKEIARLGFEYVEIWGEPPHVWARDYDHNKREKLRSLLNSLGLSTTYHAPCHGIDLSSMNPGIWKESVRQTLEALQLASELNSEVVVIHGGSYYPGDPPGNDDGRERLLRALEIIVARAEILEIDVGLENYPIGDASVLSTVASFKELLDYFSNPRLGATVDLGHAYLNGEDPLVYVQELRPYLKHIHLNDNMGDEDTHLPLGRGHVDFAKVLGYLKRAGYQGSYAMEIWFPGSPSKAAIESKEYISKG